MHLNDYTKVVVSLPLFNYACMYEWWQLYEYRCYSTVARRCGPIVLNRLWSFVYAKIKSFKVPTANRFSFASFGLPINYGTSGALHVG